MSTPFACVGRSHQAYVIFTCTTQNKDIRMSTMNTLVQRVQARVQRWHLLGRYYVNKWHYDSAKWADRVWYGQGSTGKGPRIASVAFMITRSTRQQLLGAGFPPSVISTLHPATAQKLISDKITFAHFDDFRKTLQEEQAAEKSEQTWKPKEQAAEKSEQTWKPKEQQPSALVATEGKDEADLDAKSAVLVIPRNTVTDDGEAKETRDMKA